MNGILEAAMEELARMGFAGLTVEEVAARAGVDKTTVYRRFETKERLVREALGRAVQTVTGVPDTGSVRTDLIAFLRRVADYLRSTRGKAVLRVLSAEGGNPALANVIHSLLPHEESVIPRAAIKRAMARGELPPRTDAKLVLFTMVGAVLHRVLLENAVVSDGHVEQIVDLVLFGAKHMGERS